MRALILDFDGTIVDSEPLHARALRAALEPMGLSVRPEGYVGLPDADAIRSAFRTAGRPIDAATLEEALRLKSDAALAMWERGEAEPFPGSIALVHECVSAKMPVAVCTAALHREVAPALERFGILHLLGALVTADDVEASKPDPACYRLAAAKLKQADRHCVAIEDSITGIASAKAAGCFVVAVGHTTPRERLSEAHAYLPTTAGLTLDRLGVLASDFCRT